MKKATILFLVSIAVFCLAGTADAQSSRKSVSGSEVTGTFKMNFRGKFSKMSNDLRIQALGGGKLRIQFDLIYPYTLRNGETSVNMGSLDAEIPIVGDTAVYESSEYGECKITLKFTRPGAVVVTQDGDSPQCGFGHNVFAAGTYRKVSAKKPVFTSID